MNEEKLAYQVKELAQMSEIPQERSGTSSTLLVLTIFLSGILVAGYATYDWYKNKDSSITAQPTSTIAVTPTTPVAISPTTTPSISPTTPVLQSLKIQILNGSGVPGLAGNAKLVLEESGYKNITTGNAQNYEYEQTVIMAKTDKQSAVGAIQDILKKTYQLDEQKNILDSSNPNDIVIIIGKK